MMVVPANLNLLSSVCNRDTKIQKCQHWYHMRGVKHKYR